jgi:hypothetical protein
MSWFRRNIGLDWFDLLLHVGTTMMLMVAVGVAGGEEAIPVVATAGLVALGVRRHFAMKRMAAVDREGLTSGQMAALRLEEIEQRLAELESVSGRLAELEERLDFAERLLARSSDERARLGTGASPHA